VFFIPRANLFILCFLVYFLLIVLSRQYRCKWLPGKTRVWNDLCWAGRSLKLHHSLTHSLLLLLLLLLWLQRVIWTCISDVGSTFRHCAASTTQNVEDASLSVLFMMTDRSQSEVGLLTPTPLPQVSSFICRFISYSTTTPPFRAGRSAGFSQAAFPPLDAWFSRAK